MKKQRSIWVKLPLTCNKIDLSVGSYERAVIVKIKRLGYTDKINAEVNTKDHVDVTLLIVTVSKL